MFIGRISKDQHLDTLVDWIKALPWSYFALHLLASLAGPSGSFPDVFGREASSGAWILHPPSSCHPCLRSYFPGYPS